MNLAFKKTTCRVLVVSLMALSFQTRPASSAPSRRRPGR